MDKRRLFLAFIILVQLLFCFFIWQATLLPAGLFIVPDTTPLNKNISSLSSSALLSQSTTSSTTTEKTSTTQSSTLTTIDLLASDDFSELINLKNFAFTIDSPSCDSKKVQLLVLILVHSAPENLIKRATIRETWGREDSRSRIIFLLGAVDSMELQRKLEHENRLYEDMVQGNFLDSYRNMTYKHVMALKWATYYCPQAKFILKTDDDVFVNSPAVYEFLESSTNRSKLILCNVVKKAKVFRSTSSKWYVSVKEYPGRYYPTYCFGFIIIYSNDAVQLLYRGAQKSPYFWIDDVHITGTIANKIKLTVTQIDKNLLLDDQQIDDIDNGIIPTTNSSFLFANQDLKDDKILTLWRNLITD